MIERRSTLRYSTRISCTVVFGHYEIKGEVADISQGGAQIRFPMSIQNMNVMEAKSLVIAEFGSIAIEVKWCSGSTIGLAWKNNTAAISRFVTKVTNAEMDC